MTVASRWRWAGLSPRRLSPVGLSSVSSSRSSGGFPASGSRKRHNLGENAEGAVGCDVNNRGARPLQILAVIEVADQDVATHQAEEAEYSVSSADASGFNLQTISRYESRELTISGYDLRIAGNSNPELWVIRQQNPRISLQRNAKHGACKKASNVCRRCPRLTVRKKCSVSWRRSCPRHSPILNVLRVSD